MGPVTESGFRAFLRGDSKRRPKIGFQDLFSLNAGQKFCRMLQGKHSAILSTFIKLQYISHLDRFLSTLVTAYDRQLKTLYLQVVRTCRFAYT